jgi:hypothetical protein
MGYKYSFLSKEIYRYVLEEIFEIKSSTNLTDNSVLLDIHM